MSVEELRSQPKTAEQVVRQTTYAGTETQEKRDAAAPRIVDAEIRKLMATHEAELQQQRLLMEEEAMRERKMATDAVEAAKIARD